MRAVLMLHGVDDTGSVVSVTADQLRSLVRSVRDSGHELVPLLDLLRKKTDDRSIALTFDDAFESVAREAAPLLRTLGAPAALFLATGFIGKDNRWPGQDPNVPAFSVMSWDDVRRLADQGWTIESHSVRHPDLRRLDDRALEAEMAESKFEIAQRIGRAPEVFAYPYGWFDRRVIDFCRRHYAYAVTARMDTLGPFDPLQVPRLDAYYLRDERVHRWFGHRRFHAYLGARGFMRRLRAHPGEIEVR
jgi:peptidoglycan/xylan/chitin deacetylase (PgdA/CDA1 family)